MSRVLLAFQWFVFCFHILSICSTSEAFNFPRPSPIGRRVIKDLEGKFTKPKDLVVYRFPQTLDHFNYAPASYETFPQKYYLNTKCLSIAKTRSPILAYLGSESPLDDQFYGCGYLQDIASKLDGCLLYMEHRFYGDSSPSGSQEQAIKNDTLRGYFNSAQALADYVKIIGHVKKFLDAETNPVIVFGGSYGGMLASWFRLKYPHIVLGALASSAPVYYFHDLVPDDAYYSIVSKDFKDTSPSCFNAIKNSWAIIDNTDIQYLSGRFNACSPLKDHKQLKEELVTIYGNAASYDNPPTYVLSEAVCKAIDDALAGGSDILESIIKGAFAYYDLFERDKPCHINPQQDYDELTEGWAWQVCSEIETPIGRGVDDSMFEPQPYDFNGTMKECKDKYHVDPRPHWIKEYYGGRDLNTVLKNFGSNIIYSNGLRDPWVLGGVLESLSDTIIALKTDYGSHCVDLVTPHEKDPDWLKEIRQAEITIMDDWIRKYYEAPQVIQPTISTNLLKRNRKVML